MKYERTDTWDDKWPAYHRRSRQLRNRRIMGSIAVGIIIAAMSALFTLAAINAATRGTAPHPDCPTAAC